MQDFYTILAILVGLLVIGLIVFYFYNKKQVQSLIYRAADGKFYKKIVCKKGLRYYAFLFRWFLIGRYHCEFKHTYTLKAYKIIGESLRAYIIFSCVVTSAAIIQAILQWI